MGSPNAPERRGRGLLIAGYVLALVLPVIGFVLGVVILVRRRTWHGIAIVALSLVVGVALLSLSTGDDSGRPPPDIEREVRRTRRCLERQLDPAHPYKALRNCEPVARRTARDESSRRSHE